MFSERTSRIRCCLMFCECWWPCTCTVKFSESTSRMRCLRSSSDRKEGLASGMDIAAPSGTDNIILKLVHVVHYNSASIQISLPKCCQHLAWLTRNSCFRRQQLYFVQNFIFYHFFKKCLLIKYIQCRLKYITRFNRRRGCLFIVVY